MQYSQGPLVLRHTNLPIQSGSSLRLAMDMQKLEIGAMIQHNWNERGRENVIGALINNSLTACGIVNGNVDSDIFNTWLEKILVPELPKNSVIIMDNAAFHKGHRTEKILSEYGHKLKFLPTYSPDLNPIERRWAQAKSIRRKHNCSTLEIFQKYLA